MSPSSPIVISDDEELSPVKIIRCDEELSPVIIRCDEEQSPVKIIRSPEFRRVFQVLDSSDEEDVPTRSGVKRELTFKDEDPAEPKHPTQVVKTEESGSRSTLNPLGYEKPPTKYSAETILKILLDPEIDRSRICNVWPVAVHSSTTFVVDVTKLKHPDDVRKDFFGRWKHSGSHPTPFKARVSEEGVEVERCAPGATGAVYYLRRLHGYHPSNPSFRRLIAFVSDASYNPHSLCLLVYYIPPGFTPTVLPHGNANTSKPFFPTLPSTTQRIRSECTDSGPKEVVASISCAAGGLLDATYPGDLPRGEQQVSYIKKRLGTSSSTTSSSTVSITREADELYTVMLQAHLEDTDRKFARDIKAYPEPAIVLGYDRQFADVARFCCDSFEFGVMTVVTAYTYMFL